MTKTKITTTVETKTKKPSKPKTVSVFVALDRSGSMQGETWTNAIDGLNSYVKDLQSKGTQGEVTVVAFDFDGFLGQANAGVRLVDLAKDASIEAWRDISPTTIQPSGMTPLYDAAAHVMDLALARKNKRTVVVIITDGHENASKEYTQAKIKDKVTALTDKKWEVLFLGANFDASQYASASGLAATKYAGLNLADAGATRARFSTLSCSTTLYGSSGQAVNLTEEAKG